MIPSTLCAFVALLSSLIAVNGAVVQRDGTFTYLTPQPTVQSGTTTTTASSGSSSQSSSTTPTQSTMFTTTPSTVSATGPSTTSTSTPLTTSTTTSSTKPTSVTVPSTTATSATTMSSVSSVTSTLTTTPSTPSKSSSTTLSPPTTATVTATIPTTMSSAPSSTTPTITATVPTTKSLTPTTMTAATAAAGNVNCNGVQNWQAAFAYTAGNQVIFNGQLYTARQWTYNNTPPTHSDQWTAVGTCAQPINNQANCNGVAAWQSTVVYTAGNRVTSQGHLWSAVQWTQSNVPGDASGSWKDLGACA